MAKRSEVFWRIPDGRVDEDMKRQRVALIGNVCDVAVVFGELLRSEDLGVTVYVSRGELQASRSKFLRGDLSMDVDEQIEALQEHNPEVYIWDHAPRLEWLRRSVPGGSRLVLGLLLLRLLKQLRQANVIISFASYHIPAMFSGRPYLAFSTGADLHEVAIEHSVRGWLMRRAFRRAASLHASFDPVSRANATKLKLQISGPFLLPWQIPAQPVSYGERTGPIRVLMPSRQDWVGSGRHQLAKGNDRFIRAWARRVNEGWSSSLTIVEFGDHVAATKDLIMELDVSDHVRFVPLLAQSDLQRSIEEADLVADQFDQGTPGVLALQTMATGRALSIYWDEVSSLFAFSALPPVINGSSEETLYQALRECATRDQLQALGAAGHEWMSREYNQRKLRQKLLLSVALATGIPMTQ